MVTGLDQGSPRLSRPGPTVRPVERAEVELLMRPGVPDVDDLLAELINRPTWHRRAACKGASVDLFFPERGQSTERAKALCTRCEVQSECLDAALEDPTSAGIWAGTSERGRRELRKAVA